MMSLLCESFPKTVIADGQEFAIFTDFREWLRFYDMFTDPELKDAEKVALCGAWLEPEPVCVTKGILDAVFSFFRADALFPDKEPSDSEDQEQEMPKPPVFDWKIDAAYLLGDFRRFYGIDLLTARMHWWEFRALAAALPDESHCAKRISYRSANLGEIKDKNERKRIARIQRQIALPFTYTDEMIGAALWNTE